MSDRKNIAVFTIQGRPIVKKNSRPFWKNPKTGVPMMGKSKNLREYEAYATSILRLNWRGEKAIDFPIEVECHAYFSNRVGEPDLLAWQETLWDCLQTAGVIADDKLIESSDGSRKHLLRGKNPYTTIEIRRFVA